MCTAWPTGIFSMCSSLDLFRRQLNAHRMVCTVYKYLWPWRAQADRLLASEKVALWLLSYSIWLYTQLILHWSWDIKWFAAAGAPNQGLSIPTAKRGCPCPVHSSPSVLLMLCRSSIIGVCLWETQEQWNKGWVMEHSRLQSQAVTSSAISWCITVQEHALACWKTLIIQTCPLALVTLQGRQNPNLSCFFLLQFFNELSRLEILAFQLNTVSSILWCHCPVSKTLLNTSDHLKKNYFGAGVVKLLKMPA